jgi:hypothetical protein
MPYPLSQFRQFADQRGGDCGLPNRSECVESSWAVTEPGWDDSPPVGDQHQREL